VSNAVSADRSPIAEYLQAALPASPDAYPQKIDLVREAVLVVRMDAAAYRAASFLDDRILGPTTAGAWFTVRRLAELTNLHRSAIPLHFIFHTGHVGSTLVSRLLDEVDGVLPLREPLPLRSLADAHDVLGRPDSLLSAAQFAAVRDLFMRLWARGYDATRCVVVKATSSAARLAVPILGEHPGARAIYMNVGPETYLATLLAGENSVVDLRGHGPERMRRLQSTIGALTTPLYALSSGELAAMSWLTESLTQRDAVERLADRVLTVDFDALLADVAGGMDRIVRHFGVTIDPGRISALARSTTLTRYSKAPEHAYTPELRAQVLGDSRNRNREEIRKGRNWLERLARSNDQVARALDRAGA
jgi:hypothetical protein